MKVVHLCLSSFYIDNYSYQENMLPKYHVIQGNVVTVIASLVSFDENGSPCLLSNESEKITADGYKVIRVNYKKPFYKLNSYIRKYNKIYELLQNEKPEILFIHDFSFFDIFTVIKYIKKNKNIKVFVDCHTDYINSAQTWFSKHIFHHIVWRYTAKLLTPYVQKYYGVTPLRCDFLKNAYQIPKDKIELLELGIDDELLKDKNQNKIKQNFLLNYNLSISDFIVVAGGKIDEKKNIHLLMQAINELDMPNVKLVLFGTVVPEFKDYFNQQFSDKMIHLGWLNPDQILDCLLLADLVVFPGTHSVLWEQAVGAGAVSVFKHWKGMTHVDVGGNCKFLHKNSKDEIKNILKQIIINKPEYAKMKQNALNGKNKFLYSNIAYRAIN